MTRSKIVPVVILAYFNKCINILNVIKRIKLYLLFEKILYFFKCINMFDVQ